MARAAGRCSLSRTERRSQLWVLGRAAVRYMLTEFVRLKQRGDRRKGCYEHHRPRMDILPSEAPGQTGADARPEALAHDSDLLGPDALLEVQVVPCGAGVGQEPLL